MITAFDQSIDSGDRERLLLIGGASGQLLPEPLRGRFPEWNVSACDTCLSGIAELLRRPARAVVVCVDLMLVKAEQAVAGLREAAGHDAKLILCCPPESEPTVRNLLGAGADDYVLLPLEGKELDQAIGYTREMPTTAESSSAPPAASMDELSKLGDALSGIPDSPNVLLKKLASLVRLALGASGATVIVEGAVASDGIPTKTPVLTAPLNGPDTLIGQLFVGERIDGPYTPADVEKLTHYATLIGHVLLTASRQRQWRRLALTDECSGLPNRRFLSERLADILARAAADHFPVTVLLFDVDNFKTYNDTYGHDAGDRILRVTGELFRTQCRDQDIVVRYGGDEFAVVFWDAEGPRVAGSKHPDCALAVLKRFTETLQSQPIPDIDASAEGHLTISGGLATFPWDGTTPEQLLNRADQALLAAKRAGKNRIFLIGDANQPE